MNKNLTMILAMAMLIHPHAASQSPQHDSVSEQKPQKVYHLGRDIKPPRVITSIQPSLDEQQSKQLNAGKKSGKAGSAMLTIIVGEDGTVQSAKVLESFNRDLDAKAVNAVKRWKFEPATKKGVPVAVELGVEVEFHLYK
jgi:periplasmic protein TonB